jgi:hypothetical protein
MSDHRDIHELVHLHEDRAFNRRELARRVTLRTGGAAAALSALEALALPAAGQQLGCPDSVRVPEDAPDLACDMVGFPGEASPIFAYLTRAKELKELRPGGDTRKPRSAGLHQGRHDGGLPAPDSSGLLSTCSTVTEERLRDSLAALTFLKYLDFVEPERLGAVGFCAGGGTAST